MSQASKSHTEDALGGHSKRSQTPVPANSKPGTTSTNIDEALGGVAKVKGTAPHVGPWNTPNEERESLRENAFPNRKAPADAREVAGAAARARRLTHGKLIHADGSTQASPNKHHVAKIG
jgi:hypothetical protein